MFAQAHAWEKQIVELFNNIHFNMKKRGKDGDYGIAKCHLPIVQ